MDKNTEILDTFEEIIKKQSTSMTSTIYSKTNLQNQRKMESIKPQDILKDVSSKIKAMNNADCVRSDKKVPKYVNKCVKSTFLPVNMLLRENETLPQKTTASKFDTQCVSDTQLINIIQDAEALIDADRGMTQEFDTSFCAEQEILEDDEEKEDNLTQKEPGFCLIDISLKEPDPNKTRNLNLLSQKSKENDVNLRETETVVEDNAQILNDCIEIEENIDMLQDIDMPSSPVFNIKPTKKPLIFPLESFENFEKIASPIVEDNLDFQSAKQLINSQLMEKELCIQTDGHNHKQINSQIIGKELYIQTDIQLILNNDEEISPILSPILCIEKRNIDLKGDIAMRGKEIDKISEGSDKFILKDEILFSSDEENEYIHKSFEELPFTCALETSFYDQSDVLDKTMYVGFQTASNKSIQVDTVSFTKAKSLLNDINEDLFATEPTLMELVKLCDVTDNKVSENVEKGTDDDFKATFKSADIVTEDFKSTFDVLPSGLFTDAKDQKKQNIDSNLTDFKTANGKSIDISKEPMKNSEAVHQDINTVVPNISNENTDDIFIRPTTSKRNFEGFKTASNKRIKLSDIALERTKKVFKDIYLNDEDSMETDCEKEIKITDTVANHFDESLILEKMEDQILVDTSENQNLDDVILKEFENEEMEYTQNMDKEIKIIDFVGFKTASKKEIKISEDALAKTEKIFQNIDEEFENQNGGKFLKTNPMPSEIGFKTASNKNIRISEDALAKTKNIFRDVDQVDGDLKTNNLREPRNESDILNNNPIPSEIGFKTASNKKIEISDLALAKTKTIFHDIDSLQFEEPITTDDCQNESKNFEPNVLKDINQPSTSKPFESFKTANNKIIQISENARHKTKEIFKDIDKEDFKPPTNTKDSIIQNDFTVPLDAKNNKFQGFKTASNKKVQISAEAMIKSKNLFQDIDKDLDNDPIDREPAFYGFPTSSDNEVKFSKEALEIGKKFFEDSELTVAENKSVFKGFQTASNKPVNISAQALAKSRKIFSNIDEESTCYEVAKSSDLKFEGFNTASNKLVKVTEESFIKSKQLFQDIEDEGKNKKEKITKFQGFQTASNKTVQISKEALAKTKTIFQDEDIFSRDNKSGFVGFQTASNKKVSISEDAIAKSKKLFGDLDDECNLVHENVTFKGFHTASNKNVCVSEDAIAKSRKLFENIDDKCNLADEKVTFKGFQTANRKEVKICKEALAKSKLLFQDVDNENIKQTDYKTISSNEGINKQENKSNDFVVTANNNNKIPEKALAKSKKLFADLNKEKNDKSEIVKTKEDFVVDNILNTQVLNNFEHELNTEDFVKSTPNISKRSGSPILSCPKAKKRKKFEIPYSQCKVKLKEIINNIAKEDENTEKIFTFDSNYKKNKKYNLKDVEKLEKEQLESPKNIDPYILNFNYESLLKFEFVDERNDIQNSKWTTEDLKNHFLNSVNKKLVPEGWIENHLKLILWKLISYEIKFPSTMQGICSVKNVVDQLKYRYDRELYNAVRPALRKILEKDDVSTRTIVLCVVAICRDDVCGSAANPTNIELLLTDGWYCIKAVTDKMLTKLICDRKIVVGTKLVTNGAELLNCEQGVSPWENTSAIRLKLSGNSTRRARWDARLGYHGNAAILCQLSTVKPEGGKVSKLRAFVARVYPPLYIEKFDDGSTVTRSERLEHLYQMKYETERQARLERLYEEVEREFCDQSTLSQTQYLPNSKREKLIQDIQTRVQEKMEISGLNVTRNVVPLTKCRVAGVGERSLEVTRATLSIWKPNDAILEILREGAWIEIMNVVPTGVRYSEIQISAGRQSVFSQSKYKESEKIEPYTKALKRTCYTIKDLTKNPSMITDYNEIDTVGLLFLIDPSLKEFDSTKHQFQNVYLTDADKNIICANFWGGLKKFGFENVLDTGQIISCTNLQKRAGNTRKNIPQYRVTEFSFFTKTPKSEDARKNIDDLSTKLYGVDRRKFCEDCAVLKNNYHAVKLQNNNENVSPYRFQNINMSRNKVFIDSPLVSKTSKNDENLNLTGLDFESTFKQTETQELSPKTLLRKKQVKEKIAKLKMYGEPPPLSPINIINKSRAAANAFKSPLAKSDVSTTNVASEKKILPIKEIIDSEEIQCSPILNRTYVKRNVNPVKLNFSNSVAMDENNVSAVIDHFAEDFESSPPLSLD